MKKQLLLVASALALGTIGCGEAGDLCGANCPNISGSYQMKVVEKESTCDFAGIRPDTVMTINQDGTGQASSSLIDPDQPIFAQSVPFTGSIYVDKGTDPATAKAAILSASFRTEDTGLTVSVSISVSDLDSTRQVSGSVTTSNAGASDSPCSVVHSFTGTAIQ